MKHVAQADGASGAAPPRSLTGSCGLLSWWPGRTPRSPPIRGSSCCPTAKAIGASSIPLRRKAHAAELAARGIRTITIGIGADYQADQLTALSTGGEGAFHDASEPGEINEIVIGELGALATATVQRLSLSLEVSGMAEWTLLGGHAEQSGARGPVHFDRIGAGQTVRIVVLGRNAFLRQTRNHAHDEEQHDNYESGCVLGFHGVNWVTVHFTNSWLNWLVSAAFPRRAPRSLRTARRNADSVTAKKVRSRRILFKPGSCEQCSGIVSDESREMGRKSRSATSHTSRRRPESPANHQRRAGDAGDGAHSRDA